MAKNADYVVSDPSPRVRYRDFREYDILLQLLFWIEEPKLGGKYKHFIIKDIAKRFKEKGLRLPVPINEVLLKK